MLIILSLFSVIMDMVIKMVRDVSILDINKIDEDGKFVDFNIPIMMKLTDEEIIYLRRMHKNPNIAARRVVISHNQPKQYKLDKTQKYNNRRYRIQKQVKNNFFKKVMIGGVLVAVSLGLINNFSKEENVINYDVVSELDSYQESIDSSNLEEESLAMVMPTININVVQSQREVWIKKYCDIYHVNYNVVYDELKRLTNNFSSYDYLFNYTIEGLTCKGEIVRANSEEELILYAIRCIKQVPSKLGVNSSSLYNANSYVSNDNYLGQISYFSDLLGVDKCLIYAIVRTETGFNSNLFLNSNNPAGLRKSDGWWRFDTKEEGIIELCLEVLKYHRLGAYTVSEIGAIHAPVSDGNEYWVSNVEQIMKEAEEKYEELFGEKNENGFKL